MISPIFKRTWWDLLNRIYEKTCHSFWLVNPKLPLLSSSMACLTWSSFQFWHFWPICIFNIFNTYMKQVSKWRNVEDHIKFISYSLSKLYLLKKLPPFNKKNHFIWEKRKRIWVKEQMKIMSLCDQSQSYHLVIFNRFGEFVDQNKKLLIVPLYEWGPFPSIWPLYLNTEEACCWMSLQWYWWQNCSCFDFISCFQLLVLSWSDHLVDKIVWLLNQKTASNSGLPKNGNQFK